MRVMLRTPILPSSDDFYYAAIRQVQSALLRDARTRARSDTTMRAYAARCAR